MKIGDRIKVSKEYGNSGAYGSEDFSGKTGIVQYIGNGNVLIKFPGNPHGHGTDHDLWYINIGYLSPVRKRKVVKKRKVRRAR